MLLQALAITAALSVNIDLISLVKGHQPTAPKVTCGIKTVGYRFTGAPGQAFRYADEQYVIPSEGSIELLADKHITTYAFDGKTLQLGEALADPFGFREVALPTR